jgi:hypothetical protein
MSRLTMRAEIRRNIAATDGHGHPGKPEWTLVKDGVACFVWSKVRQRVIDQNQQAEVEEVGAIFYRGTDILSFDRIEQIKDRRGRVLFAGPFEVITGTEKSDGTGINHLAFKLRRIS